MNYKCQTTGRNDILQQARGQCPVLAAGCTSLPELVQNFRDRQGVSVAVHPWPALAYRWHILTGIDPLENEPCGWLQLSCRTATGWQQGFQPAVLLQHIKKILPVKFGIYWFVATLLLSSSGFVRVVFGNCRSRGE